MGFYKGAWAHNLNHKQSFYSPVYLNKTAGRVDFDTTEENAGGYINVRLLL